jgi:hypothetical protein
VRRGLDKNFHKSNPAGRFVCPYNPSFRNLTFSPCEGRPAGESAGLRDEALIEGGGGERSLNNPVPCKIITSLTFQPSEIRLWPIDPRRNCFFPAKAAEPETGIIFDFLNADAWGTRRYWLLAYMSASHTCMLTDQRLVQTT